MGPGGQELDFSLQENNQLLIYHRSHLLEEGWPWGSPVWPRPIHPRHPGRVLRERVSFQVLFSLLHINNSTVQEVEPECFPVDWMGHALRHRHGVRLHQICLLLFCVASSLKLSNSKDQLPNLKFLNRMYRKRGRRVGQRLVPPPADHFPCHRQVYPFIVIKWGNVMYSECERLNPALAFLWGRQSCANIRSEQTPPDAREPSIKLWCWESTTHT